MWYIYDQTGITGIEYIPNGVINTSAPSSVYYFQKSLQGDVLYIVDSAGNNVVKYAYDAWGKCKILYDNSGNNIGNINPFRYRSYYYDIETGLYYLRARYYDPETGRFINADDSAVCLAAQGNNINGLNLYAYCLNNPVMMILRTQQNFAGISSTGGISGGFSYNRYSGSIGSSSPQVDTRGLGVLGQVVGGLQVATQLIGQGFGKLSSAFALQAAGLSDELIFTSGGIISKWANRLGDAYTALSNTNSAWDDFFRTSSKIAKGIGVGLYLLDVGLSAYNNFTNSNLTTMQQWGYFGTDFAASTAAFALGWFGGPIGALVGLGVWAAYEFCLKDIIRGWFS